MVLGFCRRASPHQESTEGAREAGPGREGRQGETRDLKASPLGHDLFGLYDLDSTSNVIPRAVLILHLHARIQEQLFSIRDRRSHAVYHCKAHGRLMLLAECGSLEWDGAHVIFHAANAIIRAAHIIIRAAHVALPAPEPVRPATCLNRTSATCPKRRSAGKSWRSSRR